ncbi:hypothetical protein [Pseudobutyrivibrio sp.]|uniref:hypothetical protein n=1 Tax=Pseudobutyrivibrio sp. TaxID=2014367 RepID=UPI0025CD1CB6|nr:hypothetical protein [Pseudobutyrivibrio sp.]MBR5648300.1 hypothetical protein [Pseudobutyrivibrio sp.]
MIKRINWAYYKENKWVFSILVNLITISGFLIIYSPQMYVDDMVQWYTFNGIYSGEIENHLMWMGDIITIVLKLLMAISSNIQWLYVLEITMSFVSLVIMTYIIQEYNWGNIGNVITGGLLFLYGYECYISVSFTKVAGIVGVLSVFGIISIHTKWLAKTISVVLFILSMSMRQQYLIMIVSVAIIFWIIDSILLYVSSNRRQINLKPIFLIISSYVIFRFFTLLTSHYYGIDSSWETVYKNDKFRAQVYDNELLYGDYDINSNEYEKLGITKSEIEYWNTNNNDPMFPNQTVREKAVGISIDSLKGNRGKQYLKLFQISLIKDFFKIFPLSFFSIDVFFLLYIMLFLVLLATKRTRVVICAISSFLILLLLNYYMFWQGRYLRHRVDVALCLIAIAGFLFLLENEGNIFKDISLNKLWLPVFIVLIGISHEYYSDDCFFYKKETTRMIENNRRFYNETAKDDEHIYIQLTSSGKNGGYGTYEMCVSDDAIAFVERGYLKNIFLTTYLTPTKQKLLEERGISDIYLDSINNENVYLICPTDDMLALALDYYKDRSGKNVCFTLVKTYEGKKIYKIHTDEYDVFQGNNNKYLWNGIKDKLDLKLENSNILLSGTIINYDSNIFTQDVYLDIVDEQTGEHFAYYVLQDYEKMPSGQLKANLSFCDELPAFYDEKDRAYIVIKNGNKVYSKELL